MARVMEPLVASKRKSHHADPVSGTEVESLSPPKRVKRELRDESSSARPYVSSSAQQRRDTEVKSDVSSEEFSDYNSESDIEGEDVEYDDEAKMAAFLASRRHRHAGQTREAGYVKSVTVIDFMCHRNVTLDFGAQMNFLVGHNGSGKSAVLTGLAVALGGNTAMTGRGQSIKDLIRKGADKAVIIVTLANEGDDAYRPDVYPKTIVIERSIGKTSASYTFRPTKDGKVVANKKAELSRILDAFNLHVDSPLTILTQDRARSFLQSSDPTSLYKFFMQGTLLQDLLDRYNGYELSVAQLQHYLLQEEENLPELKSNYDRLLRQQKANERLLNMRSELTSIRRELAWAYVNEKERELQEEVDKVEKQRQKIEQAEKRAGTADTAAQTARDQIEELQLQVQKLNDNEAPFTAQRDSLRKKVDEAKRRVLNLADECKACQDSIAESGREIQLYEDRIQEQQEASRGVDPAIAKLRKDIDDHLGLLSNLRRQKPKTEQDLQEAESTLEQAEVIEETHQNEALEAQRLANEHNKLIDNLKMQAKNRTTAFGDRMDLVMREIDQARWKHSKPIGPLGLHVKLMDMRYQAAFQRVMGSTLCQFAMWTTVSQSSTKSKSGSSGRSDADRGYRSGHTRGRAPPSVIQHAGERFDYTSGDLSHLNETILSKLEFDNEDVKRILINAHSIERTFVWPQISGATGVNQRIRELLRDGQQSCNFVTADGFNARGTLTTEQSGPLPRYDGNILLTQDAATNIESLRNEHAALLDKAKGARDRHLKTIAEKKEAIKLKSAMAAKLDKVISGIRRAEERVEKLQIELADKEVVDQGEDLLGAQDEARKRQRGAEEQLTLMWGQQDIIAAEKQDLSERLDELQAEIDRLAPERTRTSEALTLLAHKRSKAVQDGEYYRKSIKRYAEELKHFEQRREMVRVRVTEWTTTAISDITDDVARIHTTRSTQDLQHQHDAMSEAMKKAEKDRGVSMEEITVKVIDAEKRYQRKLHDVKELSKLVKLCEKVTKIRHRFWEAERGRMAIQAQCVFISASDKRDLQGTLDFNHVQLKLNIRVREQGLHTQGVQASYKTPQTMSGGERSFITVSLLLAMWSLSQAPIRCLDEWDVFLDHANRKVAANMLLEGAREYSNVQHLLITPQDMSGINVSGPNNKVIKMADPIRNQGILPF